MVTLDADLLKAGITKDIERELLVDMLERLANMPLMLINKSGDQVNQTQRVFWAIQFIKDFAADRGLDVG